MPTTRQFYRHTHRPAEWGYMTKGEHGEAPEEDCDPCIVSTAYLHGGDKLCDDILSAFGPLKRLALLHHKSFSKLKDDISEKFKVKRCSPIVSTSASMEASKELAVDMPPYNQKKLLFSFNANFDKFTEINGLDNDLFENEEEFSAFKKENIIDTKLEETIEAL